MAPRVISSRSIAVASLLLLLLVLMLPRRAPETQRPTKIHLQHLLQLPPPPPPQFRLQEASFDAMEMLRRRRPAARDALDRALREAIREASREDIDPLELLAHKLLSRRNTHGWPSPPSPPSPPPPPPPSPPRSAGSVSAILEVLEPSASAKASGSGSASAPSPASASSSGSASASHAPLPFSRCSAAAIASGAAVPSAPRRASRHSLPAKLPTRRMWPPIRCAQAAADDAAGTGSAGPGIGNASGGSGSSGGSEFLSLGKIRPARFGDLEQPGELKRAAAARSYRGELILTYGNEAGTAWIANLVFSLRAAGLEHFLVVVMSDEHCRALMRPPWLISCGWSSWDFGGCKNPMEMRRLWYSRHHYMSRIIAEEGLNVAVLDGDIYIHRPFYGMLKAPPLGQHNLIYTLDHSPSCGDLNVGFAYCQRCASGGPAQWVLDEGLRREGYFCGGQASEFETGGRFWNASDARGASRGPHRWQEWATARDQKLYSDIVAGSCCGAPQYKLMFPSTYKVADQYAFMRQWGQRARCAAMHPSSANALQTWWHALLLPGGASHNETVAVATGKLASGWHGTGAGELSGWSGHWVRNPPAIAHFVGGSPAGGKAEIMQGLGWWRYEADVVAYAVGEETKKKAGLALPPSFFSSRSQRGILALAGPAATISAPTAAAFTSRLVELRLWTLKVATLLQRTATDAAADCDSPWIVTDEATGHGRRGYRGKWYTPGWPWPFRQGVGVVAGSCRLGGGTTVPAATAGECCSPIFGKIKGVTCIEVGHRMLVEHAVQDPTVAGNATTLPLDSLVVNGAIDARKLRELGERLTQQVVWVMPPVGQPLPKLEGLSLSDTRAVKSLLHDECKFLLE